MNKKTPFKRIRNPIDMAFNTGQPRHQSHTPKKGRGSYTRKPKYPK